MGLGFLSPVFLLGALAASVPILVHLFRRRADPVLPFSAVRFLRRAPVEQARRRRIRDLVLLALRVAAVSLLAFSFARPYVGAAAASVGVPLTIVALDTSYSMSTSGQAERARTLARAAVDGAPAGGTVALIRFDDRAEVVLPPTMDRGAIAAAIEQSVAGARGTRYGAAVAAASDLAAGRPAHVIVISDLQQRGWAMRTSAAVPPSMTVEARNAGAPAGNLGLVSLVRSAGGPVAAVRNQWSEPRTVKVGFTIDGRAAGDSSIEVPAGATVTVALGGAVPPRGVLRASIEDPAGYAADNERYLVLDPAARARIVIVTGAGRVTASSLYLEAALAAVSPDEFELVRWSPREDSRPWQGSAAVVLLGTAGVDRGTLEDIWRATGAGTGLLVAGGPAVEPQRVRGLLPLDLGAARTDGPPLTMAPVDVRHPVFRSLEGSAGWLASVRFTGAVRLGVPSGARVLARFSDGEPALVEHDGPGRVLVLASDLSNTWNDFALHPAFVPFVHDVVAYAAASRGARRDLLVGSRPDATAPGVIQVHGDRVAVNVDPAEAERARLSPSAFVAAVPGGGEPDVRPEAQTAVRRERDQALWRYGLMVMLAALVIESVVGRKV